MGTVAAVRRYAENELQHDRAQCCLHKVAAWLAEERLGMAEGAQAVAGAKTEEDLFRLYRDLVNVREPLPVPDSILAAQDYMLQERIARLGITDVVDLPCVPINHAPFHHLPKISIWRGDITRLRVDAIVNAANDRMLGCWIPGHFCIDNAIHTYAGIQLRLECNRLMQKQGHREPTGSAKITPGYNLPASYVIHTVGPIARGCAGPKERAALRSCYISCLDAAVQAGCKNIVFCCISTGVFGFPQQEAAEVARESVLDYFVRCNKSQESTDGSCHLNDANRAIGKPGAQHPDFHVVFNVFKEEDERIYHELFY